MGGVTTPDRFGRYRVVRRIGSGGFATVWLARDEVLDAPVAVKVLADNWAHRLDVRTRFEDEARIRAGPTRTGWSGCTTSASCRTAGRTS